MQEQACYGVLVCKCHVFTRFNDTHKDGDGLSIQLSLTTCTAGSIPLILTENGVPPKWRHRRSVGQSITGRAPGWSGPSRVNNKQLTTMDIVAEYMEYSKS
jgi:hypothetical protein